MRLGLAVAAMALVQMPADAQAEVVEASEHGFLLRHEIPVAAPPQRVWDVLVQPAQWWQASHSHSGDSANLSLDLRPGGCWCEALADGGGVEHMRVLLVRPGRELRMRGGLGPLQPLGVSAALAITLEPSGGGALLVSRYAVGGFAAGGLSGYAAPVDAVLGLQFQSLARAAAGPRRGGAE